MSARGAEWRRPFAAAEPPLALHEPGRAGPPNSKLLHLVMQVLSSMITTTRAPDSTLLPTNHTAAPSHEPLVGGEHGMVPVIVVGSIFAIATTLGNLMVMISIRVDKQLQTISNYFLFSLAIADITIGIISIPLMTYYTSTGFWGIGWNMCQFWLCLDYLMSNASVLNLLLISFDRYFSITRPLSYRPRRTTKKALFAIFMAYAISMALWPPWILSWPLIEEIIDSRTEIEAGSCVIPFLSPGAKGRWASQMATVATCFFAFYLPVTIMIYLYYRVYCETRRRTAEFHKLQAGQMFTPTQIGATSALHSLMLPLITSSFRRRLSSIRRREQRDLSRRSSSMGSDGLLHVAEAEQRRRSSSLRSLADALRRRSSASCAPLAWLGVSVRWLVVHSHDMDKLAGLHHLRRNTSTLVNQFADEVSLIAFLRQVRQFEQVTNEELRDQRSKGSVRKKQMLPFIDAVPSFGKPRKSKDKFVWLKYCVGKDGTEISSEESSETNVPTNGADWISGKTIEEVASADGTPISPTTGGSARFRTRTATADHTQRPNGAAATVTQSSTAPVLHTYTVLIEYKEGESKRPSVRLSSCDSDGFNTESPCQSNRSSRKTITNPTSNSKRRVSNDGIPPRSNSTKTANSANAPQNGKSFGQSQRDDSTGLQQRKSEKERRKNERRQESKAAKTLSAILFAFIVTWTPYNVIVCWEAFYPNSVPEILFTISYFLCYVNSTINPICYACNGRFLKTYVRILRCQVWGAERRNENLYRNAYLRRPL